MLWLPIPNTKSVEAFQKHYKAETGIDIDMVQARDCATRLLQIHYLLTYVANDPEALFELGVQNPNVTPIQPKIPAKPSSRTKRMH